jgi:hypothetical protein
MISCRFKLKPEQFSPEVSVKHHHAFSKKVTFRCKMKQIPANSNNATAGHKLQGMSKDAIIVLSWPTGGLAAMIKIGSMSSYLVSEHYPDNRHGKVIPAISPTNIIHGQNKKI